MPDGKRTVREGDRGRALHAPGRATGPLFASITIRTARSRNSSGYFLGAALTLILRGARASLDPGEAHGVFS